MTGINDSFHPLANMFPLMLGVEFDALVTDIKRHGLREPIVRYEGLILDGRNRYRACLTAGVEPRDQEIEFGDRAAAIAYVVSANIHRRHLTNGQKRAIVAKLLKADPTQSDRQIAERVKLDNKTVAKIRREEEGREEIPHVAHRKDSRGRQQPARKSSGKPPKPEAPKTTPDVEVPVVTTEPAARAPELQVETHAPGQASKPHGPYSAGECDRLRARVDELGDEKRLLEIKITALEDEVEEANALLADAMVVIDNSFAGLGHDKHNAAVRKECFSPALFAWWERHIGLTIPEGLRRK